MGKSKKKTLLVIAPGQNTPYGDCAYNILVAETGQVLASHLCSGPEFAYGDLYGDREERKKEWIKKFGELEVKYIDETDITEAELLKRNKAWYKSTKKEKDEAKV